MPKKAPSKKKSAASPSVIPLSEYKHKEETVTVRYWKGVPIQIVHPQHLTCLQHTPPQPVDKGGHPSVENTIRYLLNRALFDYLFIPQDTPPQPLTRYALATLALKRCVQERNRIQAFTKTPAERKEKLVKQFTISRKSIDKFLKRFFHEPGKPISPDELRSFFPSLSYQ